MDKESLAPARLLWGTPLPLARTMYRQAVASVCVTNFNMGVLISAMPCRADHCTGHARISISQSISRLYPAFLPICNKLLSKLSAEFAVKAAWQVWNCTYTKPSP